MPKTVCSKHDQAYEVGERCQWCEPVEVELPGFAPATPAGRIALANRLELEGQITSEYAVALLSSPFDLVDMTCKCGAVWTNMRWPYLFSAPWVMCSACGGHEAVKAAARDGRIKAHRAA